MPAVADSLFDAAASAVRPSLLQLGLTAVRRLVRPAAALPHATDSIGNARWCDATERRICAGCPPYGSGPDSFANP